MQFVRCRLFEEEQAVCQEGSVLMTSGNAQGGLVSLAGPPTVVAITALVLMLVPVEVAIALFSWTLASLPIGILFGHCVLSEE